MTRGSYDLDGEWLRANLPLEFFSIAERENGEAAPLTPQLGDTSAANVTAHENCNNGDTKFAIAAVVADGGDHPRSSGRSSALLDEVAVYLHRFVRMPPQAGNSLAAYVLHTHLAQRLDVVADVHIYSADKGCGKTVLLQALRGVCAHPLNAGDASVAFIARSLCTPRTVFMDELDAIFRGDKDRAQLLRGILDQGNRKGGTYGRCEPPRNEPVEFPVFGPVVFAGIGRRNLPGTLRDRSIPICQEKMSPDDEVEPLFERTLQAVAPALRERAADWVAANADAIARRVDELYRQRRQEPVLVRLSTHGFQAWVPLVAICDIAGDDWPLRIRTAAEYLMLGEDAEDRSHLERLLANIHEAFESEDLDRIPSSDLVKKLSDTSEWEWGEWNRGKGITARQLATLLGEFRIHPRSMRIGEKTPKGYLRVQFSKAWKAYRIPIIGSSEDRNPQLPQQSNNSTPLRLNLDVQQPRDVANGQPTLIAHEIDLVADVAAGRH